VEWAAQAAGCVGSWHRGALGTRIFKPGSGQSLQLAQAELSLVLWALLTLSRRLGHYRHQETPAMPASEMLSTRLASVSLGCRESQQAKQNPQEPWAWKVETRGGPARA
jgi:hypothetical protein